MEVQIGTGVLGYFGLSDVRSGFFYEVDDDVASQPPAEDAAAAAEARRAARYATASVSRSPCSSVRGANPSSERAFSSVIQ